MARRMWIIAGAVTVAACFAGCAVDGPSASQPSESRVLVVNSDYESATSGKELASGIDTVVVGTFEKPTARESAAKHGVGSTGDVDLWQVRVDRTLRGSVGDTITVARWASDVASGTYQVREGQQAVLFLLADRSGAYITSRGDQGLLLVGSDGSTLTPADNTQPLSGTGSVGQVVALLG